MESRLKEKEKKMSFADLLPLDAPPKVPERKGSISELQHETYDPYIVGPDDSFTQIAYFHHMRLDPILYCDSVPYLKRINGLTSETLLPGQVIKVIRRKDFTINKDAEEENKMSPTNKKACDHEKQDSQILRNKQGEISNIEAIQDYLSGTFRYNEI